MRRPWLSKYVRTRISPKQSRAKHHQAGQEQQGSGDQQRTVLQDEFVAEQLVEQQIARESRHPVPHPPAPVDRRNASAG